MRVIIMLEFVPCGADSGRHVSPELAIAGSL